MAWAGASIHSRAQHANCLSLRAPRRTLTARLSSPVQKSGSKRSSRRPALSSGDTASTQRFPVRPALPLMSLPPSINTERLIFGVFARPRCAGQSGDRLRSRQSDDYMHNANPYRALTPVGRYRNATHLARRCRSGSTRGKQLAQPPRARHAGAKR